MKNTRNLLLAIVLTSSFAMTPVCYGEEYINDSTSAGDKAARAVGNLIAAPLEIPKSMINTVNDSNLALGVVGGLAKGILNTFARMGAGLSELVTIPLATKPIAYPVYVWDDFDVDTSYGPYFRLEDDSRSRMAMNQEPAVMTSSNDQSAIDAANAAAEAANRRAMAAEQAAQRAARSAAETNQKLDNMLEKTMMK